MRYHHFIRFMHIGSELLIHKLHIAILVEVEDIAYIV